MTLRTDRRTLGRTAVAGLAMALTGAGLSSRRLNAQDGAGELVLGSLEDPGSISALANMPHHFPADVPQTLIFDSLTQFLPDSTIGPKLATDWTISDDFLTYTFTLHPDARFHDDTPITAEDVKFTFDTILDPASNSSTEGAETIVSVEVVDDHTVIFTLSEVTPFFLAQGGSRGIVPKHVLDGKDIANDDFNRMPVGSGPYRVVSHTPGESIVLEAVADHYRQPPAIGTVIFKIVTDQNVILTQLKSGELSYALVTPRDLATVESIEGVNLVEAETPRYFDIAPNHARSYWQDPAVRAAVLQAIDRDAIVDSILGGHGTVLDAQIAPASWAYTTEGVTPHSFDPEAAAGALDTAGWTREGDGLRQKDGETFSFGVMLYSYDRTLQQAMLVAQQNLADIGIEMNIDVVESGVFSDRRSAGDFDALARIWNPVYDPHQGGFATGNFFGYSNSTVDELTAEGMAVVDQADRVPIYHELQGVISADLPRLFLYTENELHAISTRVTGLQPHPVSAFWNLDTWTFSG